MKGRAWLVAAACLLAWQLQQVSGWSIVRRHDVPDSNYINYAAQPQFAAVGKVLSNVAAGSGTVIANGWWVLTAAHVVAGANLQSVRFEIGQAVYQAQAVYIHPNYSGIANDIALIELSAPVMGVTPAQIYTGSNELGAIGHSVGFGNTGTGATGQQNNTYGTKRAMQNIIDVIGDIVNNQFVPNPNGTFFLSDFDSPAGNTNTLGVFGSSPTPLGLEGMGAPGDSGGPVFIQVGNGWFIAGVHSFITNSSAVYGTVLGSIRVSRYASWINSVVPEPASIAALAAGLLGLVARRARKGGKRAQKA
ncbi:MAG: trypsin-like serine protease [Armatimonadota bacterium]|nr:trypsin-like serine protease [Armatimonadota bacterium]